jgi:hypothetical protein
MKLFASVTKNFSAATKDLSGRYYDAYEKNKKEKGYFTKYFFSQSPSRVQHIQFIQKLLENMEKNKIPDFDKKDINFEQKNAAFVQQNRTILIGAYLFTLNSLKNEMGNEYIQKLDNSSLAQVIYTILGIKSHDDISLDDFKEGLNALKDYIEGVENQQKISLCWHEMGAVEFKQELTRQVKQYEVVEKTNETQLVI